MLKSNEKSQNLRQTLEHTALEQLIEAFHNEKIDAARICKLFQAYCEFKKQDAAEDKNKTSVQVARLRYAMTKSRKPAETDRDESLSAPYGTKPTGEPYTRTEFLNTLRRTVHDLYGLNFDPESSNPREPGRADPALTKPDTKPP